ncbi:MAG: hypothetical protein K6C40_11030 [Thermoguttaceae bacterium]|nr:hypothetical protein [Thermoguttaceae bacterium]
MVAGYIAYEAAKSKNKAPEPVSTEYSISITFSPANPYTIPYECNIHNAKTVTTHGKRPSFNRTSTIKTIHASNGIEFENEFNRFLRDELKPLGGDLRSITIYEEPFPGETPLDMIYNACKDQFPDVELHTTQDEYHD